MIVVSSSSLFGIWLGLELNLLSFIPIINLNSDSKKTREASVKYFLIQAIASSVVIFFFMWFLLYSSSSIWNSRSFVLNCALAAKIGLAPFHAWFPEVIDGVSWANSLILMTWQKISPIIVMSQMSKGPIVIFLALISAIIGALGGLNQTSIRKILAFSSISHIGWIMIIIRLESSLWMDYLIIYFMLSFVSCVSFWLLNVNYLSQIFFIRDNRLKILVFSNLLSTGGIPPLIGFLAKIYGFQVIRHNLIFLIILIGRRLVNLFFYVRLCISCFTISQRNFVHLTDKNIKKTIAINSLSMLITVGGLFPLGLLSLR